MNILIQVVVQKESEISRDVTLFLYGLTSDDFIITKAITNDTSSGTEGTRDFRGCNSVPL